MSGKDDLPPAYAPSQAPQVPPAAYGSPHPPQGQGYGQPQPMMMYQPPNQNPYQGGPYPQPQGQPYQQQGYYQPGYPPQGQYPQQRETSGSDSCLGILCGALACCCCLECLF
ncbi:hypothetical protein F4805DRAFT_453804 [Annulohypoxylon moriforme]|nr:hypothetical protein F4805DRAFT_453804 [Annulohypoxylon moriforme]